MKDALVLPMPARASELLVLALLDTSQTEW